MNGLLNCAPSFVLSFLYIAKCDQAVALLPPERPRRTVRHIRDDAHAGVQRGSGGAVPVPRPGAHHLAVRRRGDHVLRLLLRRAGALGGAVGVPRRRPRREDPRCRGGALVKEALERAACAREHCFCVHFCRSTD
jgi:hypothetical protein